MKLKITGLLFVLSASLLLTACDQNTDKEYYYFKHPDKLKTIFQECHAKGRDYFENTPVCGETYTVAQKFSQLTRAFMQNQQQFGQEILRLQVAVFESQQALAKAKKTGDRTAVAKLSTQINEDQLSIKKLRAIVGVFVNP